MSEVWVAALGTVASTAISYGVSAASAPGPGSVAAPPAFNPIDVTGTQNLALNTDIEGYNLADADLASRFPGLVSGNKTSVQDAYKQLTGPLDPTVQNSFANSALESSLAATGGGNGLATPGGAGSASRNAIAASIGNSVQSKQDVDRANLDSVLAANPQRSFGLSGSDVTNLSIANTQNQNEYNQSLYQSQVAQKNANNTGGGF